METDKSELQSLLSDALSLLRPTFIEGLSEFELIRILQSPPYSLFNEEVLREPLNLFQTHFVLFHSLYHLQKKWRRQALGELEIGPIRIVLHTSVQSTANLQAEDSLAEYYLDWTNLFDTDTDDVKALLDSFWQKMAGTQGDFLTEAELNEACKVLNIRSLDGINTLQLKQAYRKLQHQFHPDKGGSIERSQAILKAYQTLRQYILRSVK